MQLYAKTKKINSKHQIFIQQNGRSQICLGRRGRCPEKAAASLPAQERRGRLGLSGLLGGGLKRPRAPRKREFPLQTYTSSGPGFKGAARKKNRKSDRRPQKTLKLYPKTNLESNFEIILGEYSEIK
jgi:hypothetical protein